MMDTHTFQEVVGMSEPTDISLRPHHSGFKSWTTDWYGPDRDGDGKLRRHTKRFGKEGAMTEKQAKTAFRRWLQTEWQARHEVRDGTVRTLCAVKDLANDYLDHARRIFVKNGKQTSHVGQIKRAMEQLAEVYGNEDVNAVTYAMLAKLRDSMLASGMLGGKLTVRTVNSRLLIIKQAYKWGREKGVVNAVALSDVLAVNPLKEGRCESRVKDEIQPVARDIVDKTLAKCSKGMKDYVEVMWLTGMRPGEACNLRPCDIDRSKDTWVYTPHTHKTEHRKKVRKVAIGPRAQQILKPYLAKRMPAAYVFTRADLRFKENGPGWLKPNKPVTTAFVHKCVVHACKLARVEHWHANQLRHAWATRAREAFGIEATSDALGHSSLDVTEIYAQRSLKRAMELAAEVG